MAAGREPSKGVPRLSGIAADGMYRLGRGRHRGARHLRRAAVHDRRARNRGTPDPVAVVPGATARDVNPESVPARVQNNRTLPAASGVGPGG